jgi:uncharacterized membrane protein YccC
MLEDMAGMGAGWWRRAWGALKGTVASIVDRLRHRSGLAARRATRLTVPAVLAYVLAHLLFPHAQPLTGPLTALLVVQVSLFATLTTGLERVLAVVSGVVLAVLVSSVVDLTWWSLGAVIALAIVVGQILRLGDHLLEVPISALLVLGVASAESAAASRIAETLIGAGVGVLFTVLFPPPVQTRTAGEAVETVASCTGEVLDRVADELPHASRERAGRPRAGGGRRQPQAQPSGGGHDRRASAATSRPGCLGAQRRRAPAAVPHRERRRPDPGG